MPLDYPAHTHPGRALGNVTNGAKPPPPQQQQQVRQRSALGDISNRAAPGSSAGAKKDELPPVECLHASDPLPLASFDLSSCARPEAVARAVDEHRAPVFGASARDVGGVAPLVLEQVPVPSPWAFGSSPGPMPTFRGVPPSPFGLEAEQLGRKPAGTSHDGSERCSSSQVAPRARLGPARPASPPPPTHTHTHTRCRGLRLSPRNAPCHKQASASPKMELDMTFAMLAPELSRLQVTTADDSDEDMELED